MWGKSRATLALYLQSVTTTLEDVIRELNWADESIMTVLDILGVKI